MLIYRQIDKLDKDFLRNKINEYLWEDAPTGDITTLGTTDSNTHSIAYIQAVEDLVFAGEQIIPVFFEGGFTVDVYVKDGQEVKAGENIARITGRSIDILIKERPLLNLLQRLCGIATTTKTFTDIAAKSGVKILDTRKTTPGLRILEKYAVHCGGGQNHRLDLSSGALIKDNHLKAAGSVTNAINGIRKRFPNFQIELECDNFDQLREGLEANADGFLLDNMSPDVIVEGMKIIRNHPNGKTAFVEASGGINFSTFQSYLNTGIDAMSIGSLTHGVKSKDIRMEFEGK